jgi:hypothetical protein
VRSTIVEDPLQIGPSFCKTKPIFEKPKGVHLFLPQRIMKASAFSSFRKTKPNKANPSTGSGQVFAGLKMDANLFAEKGLCKFVSKQRNLES